MHSSWLFRSALGHPPCYAYSLTVAVQLVPYYPHRAIQYWFKCNGHFYFSQNTPGLWPGGTRWPRDRSQYSPETCTVCAGCPRPTAEKRAIWREDADLEVGRTSAWEGTYNRQVKPQDGRPYEGGPRQRAHGPMAYISKYSSPATYH